jgi:(p)ppGpp synthase/HD superfamily hydrolase
MKNIRASRLDLSFEQKQYILAVSTAIEFHFGQKDKTGKEDYVFHPIRVSCSPNLIDWVDRTIAILHDSIEDTEMTYDWLRDSCGTEVADAVVCLTHVPGEPRREYLARVKSNPRARRVKYADIQDNINRSKEGLDAATIDRLKKKYDSYIAILNE